MRTIKTLLCVTLLALSSLTVAQISDSEQSRLFVNYKADKKLTEPEGSLVVNPFTQTQEPYFNAIQGSVSIEQSDHYIASIGNSGTALLSKALALLEGKPVYATHVQYDHDRKYLLEHPEIKLIVIIRDFRDFMLSRLNLHTDFITYKSNTHRNFDKDINNFLDTAEPSIVDIKSVIIKSGGIPGHSLYADGFSLEQCEKFCKKWQILTPRQKIKWALSNGMPYPYGSFVSFYEILFQLQDRPNTLFVKFEDLLNFSIQDNGFTKSEEELIRIGNFLNLELNEDMVRKVSKNIIGNTPNFKPNTQKVGYWNEIFDESLVQHCKAAANHILIRFGYEKDNDWNISQS